MASQNTTIKYPLFSSNQRITSTDQNNQGVYSINNSADLLEKIIQGTTQAQVLYGLTVSESAVAAMTVDLGVGAALDADGKPLIVDTAITDIAVPAAHPSQARIDILEVRYTTNNGDTTSVDIIDPTTKVITPQNKDTAQYAALEYQVKQGTAGSGAAPSVTSGWTKLCEIAVGAGVTTIVDANITNVNSRYSTVNNTGWTADLASTFVSANMKEHREGTTLDHPDNSVTLDKLSVAVQAQITGGGIAKVFFGEVIWGSASTVIITRDKTLGVIRAVLKNGQVIDRATDITIQITTAANRLDGEALSNNSWYSIIFYEDATTGVLEAKVWLLPVAVVNSNTSEGVITLTTAYGYAFQEGMQVALWSSSSKFDTPYYNHAGTSYVVSSVNDLVVDSAPASTTEVVLNDRSAGVGISSYSGTDIMYGVSGFKPVVYADGTYSASIASSVKWQDSGIRVRTDGSGNIIDFINIGEEIIFKAGATNNGNGCNDGLNSISHNGGNVTRLLYCPPDKRRLIANVNGYTSARTGHNFYYEGGNARTAVGLFAGDVIENYIRQYVPVLHGLINPNNYVNSTTLEYGYVI